MVGFRLSRAQIAKIVGNDPEAIKQFERLFTQSDAQTAGIDDVAIAAGVADGKANEALATLQRIADALETLALTPVDSPVAAVDDLAPPSVSVIAGDDLTPVWQPSPKITGWAVYNHGGGTQSLAASTRTQLVIDGSPSITNQLPYDVRALWDTSNNTITGRIGDGIVAKVQCIVTPTTAAASEVLFDVDIGGGVGIVEYQTFILGKGSGNPHYVSFSFPAYTLDTWATNGGKIYATADGPCDVTSLRVLIQRTHKAH